MGEVAFEGFFASIEEAGAFIRNYEDRTSTHYVVVKHRKSSELGLAFCYCGCHLQCGAHWYIAHFSALSSVCAMFGMCCPIVRAWAGTSSIQEADYGITSSACWWMSGHQHKPVWLLNLAARTVAFRQCEFFTVQLNCSCMSVLFVTKTYLKIVSFRSF